MTPIVPRKSSTVSPLRLVVVTFLKNSPAVFPFVDVVVIVACAAARLTNATPPSPTSAIAATASGSRLAKCFICIVFSAKNGKKRFRIEDYIVQEPAPTTPEEPAVRASLARNGRSGRSLRPAQPSVPEPGGSDTGLELRTPVDYWPDLASGAAPVSLAEPGTNFLPSESFTLRALARLEASFAR